MRVWVICLFATCQFCLGESLFREEFVNIDAWKPITFEKIKSHTRYSCEKEGERTVLKGHAKASASGLRFTKSFDPYKYPVVNWRWKVSNVYKKGDAKRKKGDDYPVRIYVMFAYDPANAGFAKRQLYKLAKRKTGEYPPDSTLNYIWANRKHDKRILDNPYTDSAQMVIMQTGTAKVGQWLDESVNILDDYKKAFGKNPPKEASVAIMVDSDNTKEEATAYLDFIEVRSK